MIRDRSIRLTLATAAMALVAPSLAAAQQPRPGAASAQAPTASGVELALLRSLASNPATAPYRFATERRGSRVALRGRVGTKQVHDVAIQTAIALGVPVIDDLVIDTLAAAQVAAIQTQPGYGQGQPGAGYPGGGYAGPNFPGAGYYGNVPYIYPQPILGRLDDPFYGFEPPAIGYPPWWGALSAQRLGPPPVQATAPPAVDVPASAGSVAPGDPNASSIPYGTIDMAIDPRGVATLRGTVPTLAERIAIGQRVARTPGVSQVVNLLNIQAGPPAGAIPTDRPPPPPVPVEPQPAPATTPAPAPAPRPAAPAEGPPIAVDSDPVSQRAARAIASRAGLAGSTVRVKVRDGVAALSGRAPSVYEAMLAFRAVQQTPGVREVEDRLEFVVPDGTGDNPLIEKGRPEDVEPYLEAQVRRQAGDLAHVDRIRVAGTSLEIRGTLAREEDRARFEAILRSMPILRGFRVSAEMPAEAR